MASVLLTLAATELRASAGAACRIGRVRIDNGYEFNTMIEWFEVGRGRGSDLDPIPAAD